MNMTRLTVLVGVCIALVAAILWGVARFFPAQAGRVERLELPHPPARFGDYALSHDGSVLVAALVTDSDGGTVVYRVEMPPAR